ncbi:MAG: S-methyl-5-thioribose-1-phosphate isomerase [Phycisphaeraceae bacterium]
MQRIHHIEWTGSARTGHLRLLDQTRLPGEEAWLDCRDVEQVWRAIKRLSVRGAPAIGVAAGYACVLAVQGSDGDAAAREDLNKAADYLATSRPTAVNLFWALDRMREVEPCTAEALLDEATRIHEEDAEMCRRIGEHTLELIGPLRAEAEAVTLLTHCNAGALATGGIGTATAGMYLARERGWPIRVYADETRPLLQGARLTAYELAAAGIDVTLICDDMAAHVMKSGRVDMIITGADRIAANGDAANKIGTYNLAVLAKHHHIPFYVAAPSSTFDLSLPDGSGIPIEERSAEEITEGFGQRTAPEGIATYSPAFDVTPAELISAIITEKGVISPVTAEHVGEVLGRA